MIRPATVPLRGVRTNALVVPIIVRGIDLTDALLSAMVLQNWDNDPGDPELEPTVTLGTVEDDDGVPVSNLAFSIPLADMETVPAASEVGTDLKWVWALDIQTDDADVETKQRWVEGPFIIGGTAGGSGAVGTMVLTIADQTVSVEIDGASTLGPLVATATDAAALAQEWAENPEDDAITGSPGHYSALHWSAKAEGHADDAVAAAAVLTPSAPSYSNLGGTGDRTSLITVTASAGLIASGTASNLVDGGTGNNTTDSIVLTGGYSTVGGGFDFDLGVDAMEVIQEVRWKQSGSQTHGTWQFSISNDGINRTDVGATFTLGGSTSQTITTMAANVAECRFAHLRLVSGSCSGGPYIQEVEFKIAAAVRSNSRKHFVPDGGVRGALFGKTSNANGDTTFINVPFNNVFYGVPSTNLVAAYDCVDGISGTTLLDLTGNGYDASLTAPTNPNYERTAKSIMLRNGLLQLPSIPHKTIVVLYRTKRDESVGFLISHTSGTVGVYGETMPSTAGFDGWYGGGLSDVPVVIPRHTDGSSAYLLNRGGWGVFYYQLAASETTPVAFGGRASNTTTRVAEMEIQAILVYSDNLDATARQQIQNALRPAARRRGTPLHWLDCPEYYDTFSLIGESTADGLGLISGLTTAQRDAIYQETMIQPANGSVRYARAHMLRIGENQKADATSAATYSGPEVGYATSRKTARAAMTRRLLIAKQGVGSSRICPVGALDGTNPIPNATWNVNARKIDGLFWRWITLLHEADQRARMEGIGLRMRLVQWLNGLNDMTSTLCAPDVATYQGYAQVIVDGFFTYTGLASGGVPWHIVMAHTHDPASNATAKTTVRSAQTALQAANSSFMGIYDPDALNREADQVHFTAPASITIGELGYTYAGV